MLIDLRSDTVTRPSAAMRGAMARAAVGDDAYGEDPTVRELEEAVSARLGKEAALFVPSGTMANQIALLVHTRPGDEVIAAPGTHLAEYEAGAAAAIAHVQVRFAGALGRLEPADVRRAVRPDVYYEARSSLLALENTHNRGGGRVLTTGDTSALGDAAREHGLAVHLDGARLWHASVALGESEAALAAPADTVSVCFSKGLGAPVGSAIVGPREVVAEARRFRRRLGGGMRQAGILAAAALYGLEHHVARLADDHTRAARLAASLDGVRGVDVSSAGVRTNVVLFEIDPAEHGEDPAARFVSLLAERGLLLSAMSPTTLRAVTHLDVDDPSITRAIEVCHAVFAAAA